VNAQGGGDVAASAQIEADSERTSGAAGDATE